MDLALLIIANIIPLYILIALGYIAARKMDVNLNSIARLLIFFFAPFVTFGAILNIELNPAYILLPFILFGISTFITLTSYRIAQPIYKDGNANLIGAGGVNGNTIYFGIPIVMALFGPTGVGIWVLMNLGPSINNFTLSYYLTARGNFSVRESVRKVLTLPTLHAAILAIIFNIMNFEMPDIGVQYWEYVTGGYVVLGMMMVGIALGKQARFEFDLKLISGFFLSKFIYWPLCLFALIFFDVYVLQLYSRDIHILLALYSAMPLIGNLVAYAAENNLHPERAATAVLVSSIIAIVTIPLAYFVVNNLI
ncbi:MAG: AEC family transporter [Pseudomonadota bacterium]